MPEFHESLSLLGGASTVQVWTQRLARLIAAPPFLSPYAAVKLSPVRSPVCIWVSLLAREMYLQSGLPAPHLSPLSGGEPHQTWSGMKDSNLHHVLPGHACGHNTYPRKLLLHADRPSDSMSLATHHDRREDRLFRWRRNHVRFHFVRHGYESIHESRAASGREWLRARECSRHPRIDHWIRLRQCRVEFVRATRCAAYCCRCRFDGQNDFRDPRGQCISGGNERSELREGHLKRWSHQSGHLLLIIHHEFQDAAEKVPDLFQP